MASDFIKSRNDDFRSLFGNLCRCSRSKNFFLKQEIPGIQYQNIKAFRPELINYGCFPGKTAQRFFLSAAGIRFAMYIGCTDNPYRIRFRCSCKSDLDHKKHCHPKYFIHTCSLLCNLNLSLNLTINAIPRKIISSKICLMSSMRKSIVPASASILKHPQ